MTGPPEPGEAPSGAQQTGTRQPPRDLEACPRCGERLDEIIWGQTDCPRCGLHFECC